jgi:hypothetical protein
LASTRRRKAARAALLATGDALLRFLQRTLRRAVVAWVLNRVAICRDEEHLQPHIDAGLLAGKRERLRGHLGTRQSDIPTVRLA